jgi:hypothetical protein
MSSTFAHDASFGYLVGTARPAQAGHRPEAPSMTSRNDADRTAARVRALARRGDWLAVQAEARAQRAIYWKERRAAHAAMIQADRAAGHASPARQAALASAAGVVRPLWLRLRAHLLARWTRQITDALEDHMRQDVGFPPRPAAAPRLSPMVTAWMR